jgi:hypothetical protein
MEQVMAAKAPSVKRCVVRLSAEERQQLEAMIRKGKSPAQRLLKARILLKSDVSEDGEGWRHSPIMEALETSVWMVYHVRRQLVETMSTARSPIRLTSEQLEALGELMRIDASLGLRRRPRVRVARRFQPGCGWHFASHWLRTPIAPSPISLSMSTIGLVAMKRAHAPNAQGDVQSRRRLVSGDGIATSWIALIFVSTASILGN